MIEDQHMKLEEEIYQLMSRVEKLDDSDDKMEDDGESEDGEIREKKFGEDKENKTDRTTFSKERSNKENKTDRTTFSKERSDKHSDADRDRSRSYDRKNSSHTDRRDNSRNKKDRDHDTDRDRDRKDRHGRLSKDDSSSKDRRRSSSGKGHADRHTGEERSDRDAHGHKSKRRSRGESKSERKEKVWEPMEDEDFDESDIVGLDEVKDMPAVSSETVRDRVESGDVGAGVGEKDTTNLPEQHRHLDQQSVTDNLDDKLTTDVPADSVAVAGKSEQPENADRDDEADTVDN